MICHVLPVEDAKGAAVTGNNVMGMTACCAPASAKLLPAGNDPERRVKAQFRCVDDNKICFLATDLFIAPIQPRTVINNGGLKAGTLRPCRGG